MSERPPVHCGSDKHPDMFKTLNLLRLNLVEGPLFFIVEGVAPFKGDAADLDGEYFYEEHTCPTNFIPIEAIFTPTDDDPHGAFEYVRSVWMPADYEERRDDCGEQDAMLREIFPETQVGTTAEADPQVMKST